MTLKSKVTHWLTDWQRHQLSCLGQLKKQFFYASSNLWRHERSCMLLTFVLAKHLSFYWATSQLLFLGFLGQFSCWRKICALATTLLVKRMEMSENNLKWFSSLSVVIDSSHTFSPFVDNLKSVHQWSLLVLYYWTFTFLVPLSLSLNNWAGHFIISDVVILFPSQDLKLVLKLLETF